MYESPEGTWGFSKKPLVNRYIELCNPFSRISNLFPLIRSTPSLGLQFVPLNYTIRSLGLQYVPLKWTIRSLGLKCEIRGNDLQLENTDCLIRGNELLSERTSCPIRGNELQSERTSCPIRGNELLIRENGLHNSLYPFTYGFFENPHVPSGLSYYPVQTM